MIPSPYPQKIGLIRRNRLGDMIYTLPLIYSLRNHFPHSEINIWSDAPGCEVTSLCPAVHKTHRIRTSRLKLLVPWLNQKSLQECQILIAIKGGFDRSLARLTQRSNATIRIGFDPNSNSEFYTHPVPPPDTYEHQLKTLYRLLEPLGITEPSPYCFDLEIPSLPHFQLPAQNSAPLLFAFDCNRGQYWPTNRYLELIDHLQSLGIPSLVLERMDAPLSVSWTRSLNERKIPIIKTKNLQELGILLKNVRGFLTPEGGLAHFAACTRTKTIVLWKKDGVILKWGSKSPTHLDLQPEEGIENLSTSQMLTMIQNHIFNSEKNSL